MRATLVIPVKLYVGACVLCSHLFRLLGHTEGCWPRLAPAGTTLRVVKNLHHGLQPAQVRDCPADRRVGGDFLQDLQSADLWDTSPASSQSRCC